MSVMSFRNPLQVFCRVFGSRSHRREIHNYLSYSAQNASIGKAAARAVCGLGLVKSVGKLPPRLSTATLTPPSFPQTSSSGCRFSSLPLVIPPPGDDSFGTGGRELPIAQSGPNNRFDDPEDAFLAYRFGWCLRLLAQGLSDAQILYLVEQAVVWSRKQRASEGAEGWDSYSVSERIVHWLFLLSGYSLRGLPRINLTAELENELKAHVRFLSNHLEFHGVLTNNHLINNARALYLAGVCALDSRLRDMGRELLEYGAREMFTSSGFLQESSSHYHLLLCRTYLETFWAALHTEDKIFLARMRDRIRQMVRAAVFFQDSAVLPLVGDVSPDFPPSFHQEVSRAGRWMLGEEAMAKNIDRGWHSLFINAERFKAHPAYNEALPARSSKEIYDDSGYYRLRFRGWELILYVNPRGYVPPRSHGHSDLLGFVLHYEGTPLLIDTGRSTYQDIPLGRYARSIRAHNSISVDGMEPCVVNGHNGYVSTMLPAYYERPPKVTIEEQEDHIQVTIVCRGFERVWPDVVVTRTFWLGASYFSFEDNISGSGRHSVESFFHFHPDVAATQIGTAALECVLSSRERIAITAAAPFEGAFSIYKGAVRPDPVGWFFPRYGEAEPTFSAIWKCLVTLPAAMKYHFQIDS